MLSVIGAAMPKKLPKVSTVSILTALNTSTPASEVAKLQYSVLDTRHVYHDAKELSEIQRLESGAPKFSVAFRPERLALHEVIVAVSTGIKLDNEEAMRTAVTDVHQEVMSKLSDFSFDDIRASQKAEIIGVYDAIKSGTLDSSPLNKSKHVTKVKELIAKADGKVFGEFKEDFSAKDAIIARATDLAFTDEVNIINQQVVASVIAGKVEKSKYKQINIPEQSERLTLFVAGGQASGKGSSVARMQASLSDSGEDWQDFAKVNTDSFKSLILEPGTVEPHLYSQLAQEEASLIHGKVSDRITLLAKSGRAPHVFVDQVFVGKDKIEQGLIGGGKVRGIIVSTDVGDALSRSFERGKEDGAKGRYEHTEGILACHRNMTAQVPTTLALFIGSDVKVDIVDNNVEYGKQAEDVATIDLHSSTVKIVDKAKLSRFAEKVHINVAADTLDELYNPHDETPAIDYLKELIVAGCRLVGQAEVADTAMRDELEEEATTEEYIGPKT